MWALGFAAVVIGATATRAGFEVGLTGVVTTIFIRPCVVLLLGFDRILIVAIIRVGIAMALGLSVAAINISVADIDIKVADIDIRVAVIDISVAVIDISYRRQ